MGQTLCFGVPLAAAALAERVLTLKMPSPQTASTSETASNESASTSSNYDLVLLLDSDAEQAARAAVLGDVERSISSEGELLRHDEWGDRELAYPIRRRHRAEYHLLQFRPSQIELLGGLERSLRIADEVLRFRIVRLRPGTPAAPDMRTGQSSATEHGSARAAGPAPSAALESDSTSEAAPFAAPESATSTEREGGDAAPDQAPDASARGGSADGDVEPETPGESKAETAAEGAADSEAATGPAPDSA
jgi:small subunit ribosomal protein S6